MLSPADGVRRPLSGSPRLGGPPGVLVGKWAMTAEQAGEWGALRARVPQGGGGPVVVGRGRQADLLTETTRRLSHLITASMDQGAGKDRSG